MPEGNEWIEIARLLQDIKKDTIEAATQAIKQLEETLVKRVVALENSLRPIKQAHDETQHALTIKRERVKYWLARFWAIAAPVAAAVLTAYFVKGS